MTLRILSSFDRLTLFEIAEEEEEDEEEESLLAWEDDDLMMKLFLTCWWIDLREWFQRQTPWSFNASTAPILAATIQALLDPLISFYFLNFDEPNKQEEEEDFFFFSVFWEFVVWWEDFKWFEYL